MIKLNKNNLLQFISFNIIGLINTTLTTLLYFFLIYLEYNYITSLLFIYLLGVFFSFYMNKKFTFKYKSSSSLSLSLYLYLKMCLSYLFIFVINAALLYVFIERMLINRYLSQILAMFLLVIISFILQKFFVFKEKTK